MGTVKSVIPLLCCLTMLTNILATSHHQLKRSKRLVKPETPKQGADKHTTSATQQLEAILSAHPYELSIRPKNHGRPIKIGVFILIESITDISEKNMDLTFTLQMHETWKDPRLAFNATRPDSSVVLPSRLISKLWVPDLYIVGSKHSFVHRTMVENLVMRLFSNGEIYYSVKITATVACQMDLKTFPLDTENCFLTLQSLGYNIDELTLEWVVGEHNNDLFMETGLVRNMPKFTLVHHSFHSYNSSASDMPRFTGMRSRLQISFELKRYLLAVFFQSYFPALSMVLLAGMGMWIDPKSVPARVALGVTSVLTISTIITGLKASLPKVSYLTALDIYLWVCFLFVFSTVLEYCILNFLMMKRNAEKEKQKETKQLHMEVLKELKNGSSGNRKTPSNDFGLVFRPISNSKAKNARPSNAVSNGALKVQSTENDFCCLPSNLCEKIKSPSYTPKNPAILDSYFRLIYFIGFACFNAAYWVGYYYATLHEEGKE